METLKDIGSFILFLALLIGAYTVVAPEPETVSLKPVDSKQH